MRLYPPAQEDQATAGIFRKPGDAQPGRLLFQPPEDQRGILAAKTKIVA